MEYVVLDLGIIKTRYAHYFELVIEHGKHIIVIPSLGFIKRIIIS